MSSPPAAESGSRSRTRQAILEAATSLLVRRRTASMGEIADAASVSRSTLHRYFSDRAELVDAVVVHCLETIEQATADAALTEGPPAEAMRRLVAAYLDIGSQLRFLDDPQMWESHPILSATVDEPHEPVLDLIKRGQAEGVFDPGVSAVWIERVLWAMVYTGLEAVDEGALPRHGVVTTVIRTFERGVHTT